jgi:hypothetical protein
MKGKVKEKSILKLLQRSVYHQKVLANFQLANKILQKVKFSGTSAFKRATCHSKTIH